MTLNNKLPTDFPTEITIAFEVSEHKGQHQYQAQFQHNGKRYKLVMTGGAYPPPGDTRTVYPQNSPNGHIVFCTLYPKSDDDDLRNSAFDIDGQRERWEEIYWDRLAHDPEY